jgi:RNA polymerase sigma-70 factor (ECF subfamily)
MIASEGIVQRGSLSRGGNRFPETQQSVIERARRRDDRQALSDLCNAYWKPVYCFLRSKGCAKAQAADVTQGFFAMLLKLDREAKEGKEQLDTELVKFDPERRRFRSWLRTRAKWYFLNYIDREKVEAGGPCPPISVDFGMAEAEWQIECREGMEPDRLFDRCWAKVVVQRARARLQQQYEGNRKSEPVQELIVRVCDEGPEADPKLPKKPHDSGALRTRRNRLKKELAAPFRRCLRKEIGCTVPRSSFVDDEIELLLHALSD